MKSFNLPSLPVIIAMVILVISGFTGNMLYLHLIDKINEYLPERDQIPLIRVPWKPPVKNIRRRYKMLYPDGRLVRLFDCCTALMVICFLILLRYWVFAGSPN